MRKAMKLFMILILASQMLSAASDSASFDISAYHIASESDRPNENSLYIEIGDAVSGGILDSATGIDLTNHIEDMLTDFNADGTVSGSGHPEEIVFSYLIHGYDFGLDEGTNMENIQKSDSFEFSISMSSFKNLEGNEIKSSYKLLNTTHAFDDGTVEMRSGHCTDLIFIATTRETPINASLIYMDSSGVDFYPSNEEVCSQKWNIEYSTCEYRGIHYGYEHENSQGYSIRGAISIVFDKESYENAPNGTYTSTVTLTLTSN